MKTQKDGGPAFPGDAQQEQKFDIHEGMSLRDYFAAAALQGMRAHPANEIPTDASNWCYAVADAMLAERAKATGQST